jgi:uncharacterized membrane protein
MLARFDSRRVFQVLMALCDLGLVLGVGVIAGRRAALLAALAPLALGSVVLSRFDLWPAALAVLALAALVRDRLALSAILIGTAFSAKLWPFVLVPVAVVWLMRTRGPRAVAGWLGGATATAAAWFLPFLALSPSGVAHSFHVQFARPLQLESLGGAILLAIHRVAGTTLRLTSSYGSQNLTGPGTHALAIVTTILGVGALIVVWMLFARGPATTERLIVSSAAAVAALVAFGKVFSPQYMIWLIPFVVLVGGLRGVAASALLFAALALTQTWFPSHYWNLAQRFAPMQVGELFARDLCVVALFVVIAWPGLQHEVLGEHRSRLEALQRVRTQVD